MKLWSTVGQTELENLLQPRSGRRSTSQVQGELGPRWQLEAFCNLILEVTYSIFFCHVCLPGRI